MPPPQTVSRDLLRTYRPLQVLLIVLMFVTGLFDAVTFLDFGQVFAANMTGNIVLLGIGLARPERPLALLSLVAVAASLVGITIGAGLARRLERLGQRWIVTTMGIGVVVLILALLATVLRQPLGDYPALALLAIALGMNNATANRIHIPGETTTVVITTTLTSLAAGLQFPQADVGTRARQTSGIAAIIVGALCGAALLHLGATVAIGAGTGVVMLGLVGYVVTLLRRPSDAA